MTDEKVKVEQARDVDLATVKGIVLPSRDVTPMTKFHKLNIQHLRFEAERGHRVGWKDGQVLYMHANHQLDTIFMAAGAEVLVNEIITSDDQGNPLPANVFRHHFAAKIILPSGKVAQADCYKTWDLRSLKEGGSRAVASFRRRQKQVQKGLGDKSAKWPKGLKRKGAQEPEQDFWDRASPFLEQLVEDEMIERRVFGGELAEAGAKSRAVYDMTGLKMGVPKKEFEQSVWVVTSLFNVEEALEKMAGTKEGQELLALVALAQQQAFGAMGGNGIPGGAEALKLLQAVQGVTPRDVEEAVGDLGKEPIEDPREETIEVRAVEIQSPDEEDEPVPADVQVLIDEVMAEEMGTEEVAKLREIPKATVGEIATADFAREDIKYGLATVVATEEVPEEKPELLLESQLVPEPPPVTSDEPELLYRPPAAEPKEIPHATVAEQEATIKYLLWCGYPTVAQRNLWKTLFGEGCTINTVNRLQAKLGCQYGRDVKAEREANAKRAEGKMDTKMLKAWKDARKVLVRQAYDFRMDLDEYLEFMQRKPLKGK